MLSVLMMLLVQLFLASSFGSTDFCTCSGEIFLEWSESVSGETRMSCMVASSDGVLVSKVVFVTVIGMSEEPSICVGSDDCRLSLLAVCASCWLLVV